MNKKCVATITGIRPDFIRMAKVFEKLDKDFNHIMIHTGQHYNDELSKVFFNELKIREPDYTLQSGINSNNHYEQLSYLSVAIIDLLKSNNINPDIILFLGDSNSVMASVSLFKEGYRIGHIEGGMRSYDRRMPEEINRVICDYVSDIIFVYTGAYKKRLLKENIRSENIYVVGNTIVEAVMPYIPSGYRTRDYIAADIHRNENLRSIEQFNHILHFLNNLGKTMGQQVRLVKFPRSQKLIEAYDLLSNKPYVDLIGPYGFIDYLKFQYNSSFVVSDSGTSQEECALLEVPVIVPRLSTERPESLDTGCSILVGETNKINKMTKKSLRFVEQYKPNEMMKLWLGDGKTSESIINILNERL